MKELNKVDPIDRSKIGNFLKSLNDTEYIYLNEVLNLSGAIKKLKDNFQLSKDEFCELFNIKLSKYPDFISGNYDYTVMDMSRLNAAYVKLKTEKSIEQIERDVPVKVKTDKGDINV